MYMDYAADAVKARGRISATDVLVDQADAIVYGAHVTTADSTIGIEASVSVPFPRQCRRGRSPPRADYPVPHVESALAFAYDITGRFSRSFVVGSATFRPSEFPAKPSVRGTIPRTIDTSQTPLRFSGDGDVERFDLHRVGAGLEGRLDAGSSLRGDARRID